MANRCAVRREHRAVEILALRGLRFPDASAEDDPPAQAWPVSAAAARFDSPAILAEVAQVEVESGAPLPRLVTAGWERCCEAWLLMRVTVHWVWPVGRPGGWRRGLEQARRRVEVWAA